MSDSEMAKLSRSAGAWSTLWAGMPQEYDLVVDSNAKLDFWINHTGGLLKRVYVKAGTWTATALGATAGVLLNLDTSGTTYVFAEKGSNIVFSGGFAGTMYGLYHATLPTDFSIEKFIGLRITINNTTATGSCSAFRRITNLENCSGSGIGSTTGTSTTFASCNNLIQCHGDITSSTTSTFVYFLCDKISNCSSVATATSTNIVTCYRQCKNISNSVGTASGLGAGSGGYAFDQCENCVECFGTGNAGTSGVGIGFASGNGFFGCTGVGDGKAGTGNGTGFASCIQVVGCNGVGVASGAGTGYGFDACQNMQQNRGNTLTASKTAKYNACFADTSTNAVANTAAGGYNL
jgi:hypothetical protein